MKRRPAGKGSYSKFKRQARKTKGLNLRPAAMRGGFRL